MPDPTIQCPRCGQIIALNEALAARLEEEMRRGLAQETAAREAALRREFEEQLTAERRRLDEAARAALAVEMQALRQQVAEQEAALDAARRTELELRRRERAIEGRAKDLELEVERRTTEQRQATEREIATRLAEEHRLKDVEKDRVLADLKQRLEEANRRIEQGSQQAQGEAMEVELEGLLRAAFPHDLVEPVAKGVRGADLVQTVRDENGRACGTIIWESKNTKSWNDGWLPKLRDDQRAAKADLAALASAILPRGLQRCGLVEGVWVAEFPAAAGLAAALRHHLLQMAMARAASSGRTGKMEMLYAYLSGNEFRQRVEAFVEAFSAMREDLERERRATEAQWARREKQIQRALVSVSGLYGDMQGIIGATLPRVDLLEMPEPLPLPGRGDDA